MDTRAKSSRFVGVGGFFLFLILGLFAYFPDVFLGLNTFYLGDFCKISLSNAFYFVECFWRGEVPLWNPLNGAGAPFVGSWFTMVFYPPSLLYLLFPLKFALGWFCLLHIAWAGLGAYFLVHAWTGNRLGASLAGIVFAFNGMTISSIDWPAIIAAHAWMPWIIWITQRAVRRGGRWLMLAILFGTLQMLTGGPENILFTWILSSVVLFADTITHRRLIITRVCRFAFVVLLVALLAAIQLLPFLDCLMLSHRMAGFWQESSPLPSWGMANLIHPLFYTIPYRHGLMVQPLYCLIDSYYCGCVAILFFICALLTPAGNRIRMVLFVSVLFGVLAMGGAGYLLPFLINHFPYLSLTRYPFKYFYVASWGLAMIVGLVWYRIDATKTSESHPFSKSLLGIAFCFYLVLLVFLIWFEWNYPINEAVRNVFQQHLHNALERAVLAAVFLFLVLMRHKISYLGKSPIIGFLLLITVWLDLATHKSFQIPTVTTAVYEPGLNDLEPAPTLGKGRCFVPASSEEYFSHLDFTDPITEVVCGRRALIGSTYLLDGYGKFLGVETMYLRGQYEIFAWLNQMTHLGYLADFLGIIYYNRPPKTYDWIHRTNAMSLVSHGQTPVFLPEEEIVNEIIRDEHDLRQRVYLPLEDQGRLVAKGNNSARIENVRVHNHLIEFDAEATEPTLATIAQTDYPPWRAFVNNRRTAIYRANHAYQAIELPPGQHHVRVQYVDTKFRASAIVSVLILGMMLMIALRSNKKNAW